jgi:hypothetical protein
MGALEYEDVATNDTKPLISPFKGRSPFVSILATRIYQSKRSSLKHKKLKDRCLQAGICTRLALYPCDAGPVSETTPARIARALVNFPLTSG